ncbi:hypothetical protein ACT80S_09965 [Ramlibacter sp. MAHUQ-53]
MITDDARIVDAQACQVESWQRINRDGPNRFWAVPACNPTGNLELSVGGGFGATEARPGERRLVANLFQGKTLIRPLTPDGWGIGLAVGRSHDLPGDSPAVASNYFYVPASWAMRGDDVVLHLNLGMRDDRAARRSFGTWGLGSEIRLAPQVQLIAEAFGENRSGTHVHGGLRWWVVPDRVQVDATLGSRLQPGTSNRWMSLGVRLLSPPFLP